MAFGLQVRITDSGVEAKMRAVTPAIMRQSKIAITRATLLIAGFIKQVSYPASGLHVRSGALRRSIRAGKVEQTHRGIVGRVLAGQKLAYARAHEYGAIIRPVHGQYLAIPLAAVKTESGVARFGPRQAEQAGYKTFIAKDIIFGKKQGDKTVTPLFALKRQVIIPERPYFRPGIRAKAPEVRTLLEQAIRHALQE